MASHRKRITSEEMRSPSVSYGMEDRPHSGERLVRSLSGHEYKLDNQAHLRRTEFEEYGSEKYSFDSVYGGPRPGGRPSNPPRDSPSLPELDIDDPADSVKRPWPALSGHDLMAIFPPNPPRTPNGLCDTLFKRQMHEFLSELPPAAQQMHRRDPVSSHLPIVRSRSIPSPISPVETDEHNIRIYGSAENSPGGRRVGISEAPQDSWSARRPPPPSAPAARTDTNTYSPSAPPGYHHHHHHHPSQPSEHAHSPTTARSTVYPGNPVNPQQAAPRLSPRVEARTHATLPPHAPPAPPPPAREHATPRLRRHSASAGVDPRAQGHPPTHPQHQSQSHAGQGQVYPQTHTPPRPRTPLSCTPPKITLIQCNPQNTHPYNPPLTKTPFVRRNDTEAAHLQKLEHAKSKEGYIPRMRAPKKTCGREDCRIPYCRSVHHRKGAPDTTPQRQKGRESSSSGSSQSHYTIDLTGEPDDP